MIIKKIHKEKVDKGFKFFYYGLSYRRRMIRDLYFLPIYILVLIYAKKNGIWGRYYNTVAVILILIYIFEFIYNYKRYIKEKNEKSSENKFLREEK